MKRTWGFDEKSIDRSVRPQDDFYRFAVGSWIKSASIPHTEARWGSFNVLRRVTDDQLRELVEAVAKKKNTPGSPQELVATMYRSAIDEKKRNALGLAPLLPYLARLDKITNHKTLARILGELELFGIGVPWGFAVDQDAKQSETYVLHFFQSGLGMPDREYYLEDGQEFLRVRAAYHSFVERMHRHLGLSKKDAAAARDVVLRIETELARLSMCKEDARDADKTYHKYSWGKLTALFGAFDFNAYARAAKVRTQPYAIVAQPEFMQGAARLLTELPLEDVKTYLRFHLFLEAAPYLSSAIVKTNFAFYGTVLYGLKSMKPLWRRALGSVNGTVGFALGKLYVERHYTNDAHAKMHELVDDLFAAYEARIKALDWMSPQTKKFAIRKLRAIARKVGYPTVWRSYKGLELRRDDYFGNIARSAAYEHRRELQKLKKRVDRTEWFMTPQTVNAYCSFSLNEIVFPAAILQPPFFDPAGDMGVNYGAIGSVIGHELTHAFDDQGSKFDEKGNMKSWWTKEDRARFDAKAALLVEQYGSFSIDGTPVNGQLTLGENIADLGGAVIAFDAYQRWLDKHGRETVRGFTPEERFFLGFAQQEKEISRVEYAKTAILTDPHAPAEFRINGPLTHVPGFYETYAVAEGDALYRPPEKRAHIW